MCRYLVTILMAVAVGLSWVFVTGCQNDAQTGALLGTAIGVGAGQAIGGNTESTLIGAAVGGTAGYLLGNESDKRKTQAEMVQLSNETRYVTVNIKNSNGSISQVRLKKHGVGYLGTRGEFYDHLPTQDELRPIYGF
jgi:outer membrane lipoprotein SlyB